MRGPDKLTLVFHASILAILLAAIAFGIYVGVECGSGTC